VYGCIFKGGESNFEVNISNVFKLIQMNQLHSFQAFILVHMV